MNITITDSAQEILSRKLGNTSTFLLVTNDGANDYSSAGGACTIGDRFLLVPIEEAIDPFTIQVPSNHFKVYISDYEKMFLGQDIVINFNKNAYTLVLTNETGILDNNLATNAPVMAHS
ncbi:MAG: iron-sulfur cluster biosynthesis family protein [Enterococcus sp.]